MTLSALGLSLLLTLVGCDKSGPPPVAPVEPVEAIAVLEQARARPVPSQVRVRFQINVRSEALDVAGSTGGGLVLARPGRGRLDVMGPLGSPLVSIAADGQSLDALLTRKKRHLQAASADQVIQEITKGAAGIDDLLAVLQGDLPFDRAPAKSLERIDDTLVRLTLGGPKGVDVRADLNGLDATPRRIEAYDTEEDRLLLAVDYEDFTETEGVLYPEALTLTVPALDLVVTLEFKTWQTLDEVPEVFALKVPESIVTEKIEDVLKDLGQSLQEPTDEDAPDTGPEADTSEEPSPAP